jgi:hypothetical protein
MALGLVLLFVSCLVNVQSFSVLETSTQRRSSDLVGWEEETRGDRSRSVTLPVQRVDRQPDGFPENVQASAGGGGSRLPTVLEQIVNERAEFQINLGRAMDTLQGDMPYILKRPLGSYHRRCGICVESPLLSNHADLLRFSFLFSFLNRNENRLQHIPRKNKFNRSVGCPVDGLVELQVEPVVFARFPPVLVQGQSAHSISHGL